MTQLGAKLLGLEGFLTETRGVDAPQAMARIVRGGFAELPLPGQGATASRFAALRAFGRHELSTARLVEGHVDAVAILREAKLTPPAGALMGVWAAGPLGSLQAVRTPDGWCLRGVRRWCSGAPFLTHALVRADADDGDRLFVVSLDHEQIRPEPGSWRAVGMADSFTLDVEFDSVQLANDAKVGGADFYLSRRGFWIGAIGVAAVWYGGAEAVATTLTARAGSDPHRLAHLGAVTARLFALDALFAHASKLIDEQEIESAQLERLARIVRAEVESGATEILQRTGRATGADPLGHDAAHARRVADLTVYLRQSHGEADLAALGEIERARSIDQEL